MPKWTFWKTTKEEKHDKLGPRNHGECLTLASSNTTAPGAPGPTQPQESPSHKSILLDLPPFCFGHVHTLHSHTETMHHTTPGLTAATASGSEPTTTAD